jgi:hypothetical protein
MHVHPVLAREVITVRRTQPWFAGIVAAAIAVTVLMGLVIGPRAMRFYSESKRDIAQLTVNKYVREAYPQWAATRVRLCPDKLIALNEFMNAKDTRDPWGEHYRMLCDERGGLVVYSMGEDQRLGTSDDVWSRP